jgi:hypothetical protein
MFFKTTTTTTTTKTKKQTKKKKKTKETTTTTKPSFQLQEHKEGTLVILRSLITILFMPSGSIIMSIRDYLLRQSHLLLQVPDI